MAALHNVSVPLVTLRCTTGSLDRTVLVNMGKGETVAHLQNTYLPTMVVLVQSRAKLMSVNNESARSVIPALLAQGQCPDGNSQRTKQRSGNSFLPFITNRQSEADQDVR